MRNLGLATVKSGNTILHTVPQGNRHTLCGVVAEHSAPIAEVGPKIIAGTHRMCKNCARVTPARDTRRPVDPFLSEHTNTWSVMNRAGREIARVDGETMVEARDAARKMPAVRIVSPREGGFSLRRLTVGALRAEDAVDALEASWWPTVTLRTVLRKDFGLHADGRRVICAALAARGVTPEGVRVLNA